MHPRARRASITLVAALQAIGLVGVSLTLVACGGSSDTTTPASNFTIGGTITGLTVSSVVLVTGNTTVTVGAGSTSWTFPGSFAAGTSYSVSVQTQPTGELCEITSGASGMDTGTVGNVTVVCGFGEWTSQSGSDAVNASGVYGALSAPAVSNVPGARYSSSSWTGSSGNFWLFGGVGYDSTGTTGYLNDLWEYSPSTKEWTWASGGYADNASGVYGTEGTAAATNVPGSRYSSSSWTDASGNLWLFGGVGYDSAGTVSKLNDLWRFSPTTGQWTWVSGANVGNASGVYGTAGTASASTVPGARYSATTWIDTTGNLWLFGGYGYDAAGAVGNLNDLWRFSPTTGQWTWVGGGSGENATGIYGTEATAATTNVPGARYAASSWIDASGNLWLFGGYGYDSTGTVGKLNDLWQFTPSTGQWTWIGGEDVVDVSGVYGVLGTAADTNVPGARQAANTWIDSSGNLWLFGGVGYDLTGGVGNLNDLWEYDPSTKDWTYVSGGFGDNASGIFGTQGTAAVENVLGSRNSASSWIDSSGNFWVFGGYGFDATGNLGYLNDLWQYTPGS